MTVRRAAPLFGAARRRAALLDRRSPPVRPKPDRLQRIWACPRLAASLRRLDRCSHGGPDSRSGRSWPRLINPDRFDKKFHPDRLERVDQEPGCNARLRISTVRARMRRPRTSAAPARTSSQTTLCDNAKTANIMIRYGAGERRQRSDLGVRRYCASSTRQVLPGDVRDPDRPGVQGHRHLAVDAARGAPMDISLANEKSPAGSAGLFDSRSPES